MTRQKEVQDDKNAQNNEDLLKLQQEFDTYKELHSHTNEEFEELQNFKRETLANNVLSEFTELDDIKEFKELKEHASEYEDLDALRNQCYAIKGRNIETFTTTKTKTKYESLVSAGLVKKTNTEDEPYGGMMKNYEKK